MQRDLIQRELVQFGLDVDDQEEFFDQVVAQLVELGYAKPSFLEALKAREAEYPTALPTQPEAIAIPHADPEHVIRPFIAAVRLKNPIEWNEMGNNESVLSVRFVFTLGFTRTDGHVKLLQVLLNNIQDSRFMEALAGATSADEYYASVHGMRGLED